MSTLFYYIIKIILVPIIFYIIIIVFILIFVFKIKFFNFEKSNKSQDIILIELIVLTYTCVLIIYFKLFHALT